jgi:CubicO group peptidase (beta-lactamase class C family)
MVKRTTPLFVVCLVLALPAFARYAAAADAEAIARHGHVTAIEALMATSGDDPLQKFADEHFAPAYRDSFPKGKLIEHLRAIRSAVTNFGGLAVDQNGAGVVHMKFMLPASATMVRFAMQEVVPYQITAFDLESTSQDQPKTAVKAITWDTLAARMDEEAKNGFSGTVYAMRDGKVVLEKGYGAADRDLLISNSVNTIYAIGSTPIDFTRAAVLKLEQNGKLKTSDSIAKYFHDVPSDKKNITIDQLMSGASGLPNFHHLPGVDADPDLTWIDRETALQRIFGEPLLFKPGQGSAHSHSAWVLLAALVENVSGQAYIDFVTAQLFKPAGMTSTFLHEGLRKVSDRQIAIGYGGQTVGKDNKPKYWGRTSWLVMGSGGMVSTTGDLARFITAVHNGTLLNSKEEKKFGGEGGMWVGGDDRGFFCLHAERGKDMVIVMSNAHSGPGDLQSSVGEALGRMALGKN